jgi:hypothetical protein
MSRLAEMPEFRRVTAEIDFSGAMQEAAQFSDDWSNIMRQSVSMTEKASKERLEIEKKAIEKAFVAKKKQLEDALKEDIKAGKIKAEDAARTKAEIGRTLEANKQLEISKKVTEQKKIEVERAKQAASYATEMVDLQQQVTDAESQFLTEIGGNWQTILDLQAQSVNFEKQKAEIAQQLVDDLIRQNKTGRELAQAQTAAKLAELRYQQKALGAQKSAYEALLGVAFGAIRSSAGVRKGMDTAAMKLGREDSRVRTRSGMFRSAGPGGPMTIEQRAAMGQLAGVGGGVAGAVPKKMTTEQLMEDAKKTADENLTESKKTAEATSGLYALGHTKGSIYTADTTSQDWLSKICDYAGKTVEALNQMFNYMSGSSAGKGMRKEGRKQWMEQKEATKEVANVKEAVVDSTKVQQGAEEASKETAGKVSEVKLSLADQLNLARAEFQAANKQLVEYQKNSGTSQQIEEATARTQEATQKVLKIQDQIRVNEMKNPMIGVGSSIEGMADILHGDVGQPMKDTAKNISTIKKENKKKGNKAAGKGSEANAAMLAAGGGGAGLTPGGTVFPDWEEFRYQIAAAKGKQLNTEAAKGGDKRTEDITKDADKRKNSKNTLAMKKEDKKKGNKAAGKGSESIAAMLAAGGGGAGLTPGGTVFPDWEEYRYQIAAAKGEQLNTEAAKGGEAIAEDMKRIREKYNEASKFGSNKSLDVADSGELFPSAPAKSLEDQVRDGWRTFPDDTDKRMETAFSRRAGGVDTAPGQTETGFAGMGADTGVGGGGAMKVTGEITVKFDSKMFKSQVVQIVGEAIRTGDIRKAMVSGGFLNDRVV